jgi:hypothetical protein
VFRLGERHQAVRMQNVFRYGVVVHRNGTLALPLTDMTLTRAAGRSCG